MLDNNFTLSGKHISEAVDPAKVDDWNFFQENKVLI